MAIPQTIKDLANKVRTAVYGKDVRESLAKSMEETGNLADETKTRQDSLETQFQTVLDETTGKDVVSAPEILAARGSHPNLKDRLDTEHTEVMSSLAQIAQQSVDFVNVKEFGATGDGATDDTQAFYDALQFAKDNAKPLYIPSGNYSVSAIDMDLYPQVQGVLGNGTASKLIAREGTLTVLKWRNVSGKYLKDFLVDCNKIADIGIDTDWDMVGPSAQNYYSGVTIQNYNNIGWKARNNNDTTFYHINVRQPNGDNLTAFDVPASGGLLTFIDCFWLRGSLRYGAINLNIQGGAGDSVIAAYNGHNFLKLDGCYLYSREKSILMTEGTSTMRNVVADGCEFVINNYPTARLISGKFDTQVEFNGCHFSFASDYTGTKEIFGDIYAQSPLDRIPQIVFNGGSGDSVVLNEPTVKEAIFKYNNFLAGAGNLKQYTCGFTANVGSVLSGVTGDSSTYDVIFNTEKKDHQGFYNNVNGVFTAPETGLYHFSTALTLANIGSAHTDYKLILNVNGVGYTLEQGNAYNQMSTNGSQATVGGSLTVPMSKGQTAKVSIKVGNGSKTINVSGGEVNSWFSGHLIAQ